MVGYLTDPPISKIFFTDPNTGPRVIIRAVKNELRAFLVEDAVEPGLMEQQIFILLQKLLANTAS